MRARVHRRIAMCTVLLAMLLVAAACGGGNGDSDDAAPDEGAAGGSEVVMELIAYKPERLEVDAGASVTWTNLDIGAHTVTSGTVAQSGGSVTPEPDGTFDSGELATDDTFEQSFDEPGTYQYFCLIHPATMQAEIRVT